MAAPIVITVPKLVRRIGLPDVPVIIDIPIETDFSAEPFLTRGKFRHLQAAAKVQLYEGWVLCGRARYGKDDNLNWPTERKS